jgi:hypothetical protein
MRRWLILSVCAGLKVFNSNFPFAKTEIRIEDWIYKFNDYRCLNSQPLTLFMRQEYTNSSIAWRTDFYNSYFAQISTKKVISGEAGLGIDSPIKTLRVQTRSRCYAMMKYKDAGTVGEGTLTSDWSDFKETIRQKKIRSIQISQRLFLVCPAPPGILQPFLYILKRGTSLTSQPHFARLFSLFLHSSEWEKWHFVGNGWHIWNPGVISYALIPRCRPNSPITTDYKCADKKRWRVEMRHYRHSIGLDSLFQKTPMFTPEKWTVKPRDALENTAF